MQQETVQVPLDPPLPSAFPCVHFWKGEEGLAARLSTLRIMRMSGSDIQTYHFTVIVMQFILKCCHDAREVGHQLPKPEHLGP